MNVGIFSMASTGRLFNIENFLIRGEKIAICAASELVQQCLGLNASDIFQFGG